MKKVLDKILEHFHKSIEQFVFLHFHLIILTNDRNFLAFKPKASEENEHSCTGLTLPGGERIFFKQIAGGFARRIVCYAHRSSAVKAGEQCGIIKFGSRIDLFLPLDAELKVAIGDYVRACESVIAELPAGPSSVARQK